VYCTEEIGIVEVHASKCGFIEQRDADIVHRPNEQPRSVKPGKVTRKKKSEKRALSKVRTNTNYQKPNSDGRSVAAATLFPPLARRITT